MKVLICAGHTLRGKGTGAVGYINESNENRILSKKIVEYLKAANTEVDYYEINEASDYLQKQVAFANKKNYDVVVQVHFNAANTTNGPVGTETLYDKGSSKGREYAKRVNTKLASIFKDRGAKERDDLYWLNNTKAPAILIETCFVDSKADTDIYNKDKDKVAKAIAEGIINKPIQDTSTQSIKTGWVKDDKGWSYIKDGVWQYNWKKIDNKWYYLKGGYAVTGWNKIDNKWYYFNDKCEMVTGWLKDKDKWYYLKEDGSMAIGWIKVDNKWYYLNSDGSMKTGLLEINGKKYYLKDNGELVVDKDIEINSSGEIKEV